MEADPTSTQAPWRLVAWLVFVLVLAALNYAARLVGPEAPEDLAYRYGTSVTFAVQGLIVIGVLLLIALVGRGLPPRDAFALRRPVSWRRGLGLALAALIAIWLVSAALAPLLDASEEQGLVPDEWDPDRAGAFAAFFASATIVAPVVEELTYRGLGFTLIAPYGTLLAIAGTAVLFAAAHGLLAAFPVLAAFGALLGWLRARTDSVYPCILLHATFNGVVLVVSVTVLV